MAEPISSCWMRASLASYTDPLTENSEAGRKDMDTTLTAKITEWNREKGYGFLQAGRVRVFLHIRDFAEHHKEPAVGDAVHFMMGRDARGRTCATNARHVNDGGRLTMLNAFVTVGLLVLPAIALHRRAADFRWVGAYVLVLGAVTYWAYALDKRRARDKQWRLSEGRLHLLELLGGWPGAFLAQRRLRHKCSKGGYQVVFWVIVLAYQFVAFDSLMDWRFSHAALTRFERALEDRK
jgi:uncharacterized membrane protein YsdA (DUF1294 family)/cold shock CspA family protein